MCFDALRCAELTTPISAASPFEVPPHFLPRRHFNGGGSRAYAEETLFKRSDIVRRVLSLQYGDMRKRLTEPCSLRGLLAKSMQRLLLTNSCHKRYLDSLRTFGFRSMLAYEREMTQAKHD